MPAIVRPTLTYLAEFGVRDGSSSTSTKSTSEVTATRKFIGLWSERASIADYFLGHPEIEWNALGPFGGEPVRLRRLTPLAHPEATNFYATRITVEHNHKVNGATLIAGDASKAANYRKVVFNVIYEKPKYDVLQDADILPEQEYLRWTEWPKGRTQADVLTFKAGSGTYRNAGGTGASGQLNPYGQNRVQPVNHLAFIWRDLPPALITFFTGQAIPWQLRMLGDPAAPADILMPGTINLTTFAKFGPGTLFLQNWEWDERPAPVNDPSWTLGVRYDITFNILHRPTPGGWNSLFYSDPNGAKSGYYYFSRSDTYHAPGAVPDYDSLYNEREFRDLWKVQA